MSPLQKAIEKLKIEASKREEHNGYSDIILLPNAIRIVEEMELDMLNKQLKELKNIINY